MQDDAAAMCSEICELRQPPNKLLYMLTNDAKDGAFCGSSPRPKPCRRGSLCLSAALDYAKADNHCDGETYAPFA